MEPNNKTNEQNRTVDLEIKNKLKVARGMGREGLQGKEEEQESKGK